MLYLIVNLKSEERRHSPKNLNTLDIYLMSPISIIIYWQYMYLEVLLATANLLQNLYTTHSQTILNNQQVFLVWISDQIDVLDVNRLEGSRCLSRG